MSLDYSLQVEEALANYLFSVAPQPTAVHRLDSAGGIRKDVPAQYELSR